MPQTEQQRKNEEDLYADHRWCQPAEKRTDAKEAWKPLDGIELN